MIFFCAILSFWDIVTFNPFCVKKNLTVLGLENLTGTSLQLRQLPAASRVVCYRNGLLGCHISLGFFISVGWEASSSRPKGSSNEDPSKLFDIILSWCLKGLRVDPMMPRGTSLSDIWCPIAVEFLHKRYLINLARNIEGITEKDFCLILKQSK